MVKVFTCASLLLAACADSDAELFELDDEAAETEGKADGLGSITRLERATPAEVTAGATRYWKGELGRCFAGYKARIDASAVKITKEIADRFGEVDTSTESSSWTGPCRESYDLEQIVIGVLDANAMMEASVTQIANRMPAWIEPQLADAIVGGYVEAKDLPTMWYGDLQRVQNENARARENNPTGVNLAEIRAAWDEVRDETTLDREYLNPVTFPAGALEGTDVFRYLRRAFPLRTLTLQSTGYTAVDDFASADEGPEGDPAFQPIGRALKKNSIKKRFYFARQGEWSSNVLIVVDNKGQAWGMQMGYSE
ncbi:MAG: hypothetical protein ACKV2T_36335 [Kofleriaceae bacterium]